ncbi:MRT4-like protein, partial [Mya arenaria]
MPKSKRDKKISLTQTRKKGLELKQKLIEDIRESVDQYARIFTFSVLFWKKQSDVISARQNEFRRIPGKSSQHLHTLEGTDRVALYQQNQGRSVEATQEVTLEEGPLPDFSHAMEPQLRQLGLPTALKKGVITLLKDHKVCNLGQILSPEQARILKLFGYQMAEFKVTVENMWSNTGKFEEIEAKPDTLTPTKVRGIGKASDDDNDDDDGDDGDDDDDGDDGDDDDEYNDDDCVEDTD